MPRLPFIKMQGLGNDFLVFDLLNQPQEAARLAAPGVAQALCERRFGIGADGVLLVLPSARASARMQVLNADGSEAEMCGNGLRCVARLLLGDPALRLPTPGAFLVETGAGVLRCSERPGAGGAAEIEVDMGAPQLLRSEIPMTGPGHERFVAQRLFALDREFLATAVSMGNPHVVIFLPEDEPPAAPAQRYGPYLERDPHFPARTNVEFARLSQDGADLVVWERGCGVTLACGTGACATVVAGCLLGLLDRDRPHAVRLPGGALQITWSTAGDRVLMSGPAVEVFRGSIELP
jgi:diaminopimelate epimerase